MPSAVLYDPPGFLYFDDHWWHETVAQSPEPVPRLDDFRSRRIEAVHQVASVDAVDLVLEALAGEDGPDFDGSCLVKLLGCGDPDVA